MSLDPFYEDDGLTLYCADVQDVIGTIDRPVSAVVTSPPYAQQRADSYGGIDEDLYPQWTLDWMNGVPLESDGSIIINIREHIRDGEMSDYVHNTRRTIRDGGWIECDELIWIKPEGPPFGHPKRPRRAWERILWFSKSRQPWCDPRANGKASNRLGMRPANERANRNQWSTSSQSLKPAGIARQQDWVSVHVRSNPNHVRHPAAYPPPLARWMVTTFSKSSATVLDPFAGSGTTLIAAHQTGRHAIGIERSDEYCDQIVSRWKRQIST